MSYIQIIKESAQIFWKHKSLWVFGIIAALVGQGDYNFSVNYQESFQIDSVSDLPTPLRSLFAVIFENPLPFLFALIGFSLFIGFLQYLVALFANGAMIGMVGEADRIGSTSFTSGLRIGGNRILPLFVIYLLLAIPFLVLVILGLLLLIPIFLEFLPLLSAYSSGDLPSPDQLEQVFRAIEPMLNSSLFLCCGAFCIFVLAIWVTGIWATLAARSCVIENLGVLASLKRGGRIGISNLGYTLLNWLILIIFRIVFVFFAGLPALTLWIPTAQAIWHGNWTTTAIITGVLTVIYLLLISIGLGGVLTSFNSTLWTKLYIAFVGTDKAIDAPAI
jgi:hypothetical protein